jgi:hypothetical protein
VFKTAFLRASLFLSFAVLTAAALADITMSMNSLFSLNGHDQVCSLEHRPASKQGRVGALQPGPSSCSHLPSSGKGLRGSEIVSVGAFVYGVQNSELFLEETLTA